MKMGIYIKFSNPNPGIGLTVTDGLPGFALFPGSLTYREEDLVGIRDCLSEEGISGRSFVPLKRLLSMMLIGVDTCDYWLNRLVEMCLFCAML